MRGGGGKAVGNMQRTSAGVSPGSPGGNGWWNSHYGSGERVTGGSGLSLILDGLGGYV